MDGISIAMSVLSGSEEKYLDECIDTSRASTNGRFIEEFQERFAAFCGTKYALACSNGAVVLHLALLTLEIKPGDEVVIPTLTYIATANVVKYCGAIPVFVDSEINAWNINPKEVRKTITSQTKAIIPAHLYGLPSNMREIMKISGKYKIPTTENAARAHGVMWENRRIGSIGAIGSFSFFGNKIITSGEDGIPVTNDENLFNRIEHLRSQGIGPSKRYWHTEVAYNYRMTNMQAAVGLGQLEKIRWHLEERQRIRRLYDRYLCDIQEYTAVQDIPAQVTRIYWMYPIVSSDNVRKGRDKITAGIEKRNIKTGPVFYPIHIMPPCFDANASFPIAEYIGERGINLPTHSLLTEDHIKYIVNSLKDPIRD